MSPDNPIQGLSNSHKNSASSVDSADPRPGQPGQSGHVANEAHDSDVKAPVRDDCRDASETKLRFFLFYEVWAGL